MGGLLPACRVPRHLRGGVGMSRLGTAFNDVEVSRAGAQTNRGGTPEQCSDYTFELIREHASLFSVVLQG